MSNLKHKVLDGLGWSFKAQIFTQMINFIVGILLMKLLTPDDFGRFAMVFIVVSFLKNFSNLGLTAAIIQRKNIDEQSLSTAFWFQTLVAINITGCLLFFGHIFNDFYKEEILNQVSFWLGIDFFIGSLGMIPLALLQKELNFKVLFKIQLTSIIISSFIGIFMALSGLSIFSLIGKILTWTTINSLGTYLAIKWRPTFNFSFQSLSTLLQFGIPATGNQILTYLVRNSDDFFIGRVIGSTSLGLYNRAYMLMLLPIGNISSVITNVLFPSWSKMQNDIPKIKRDYIRISGIIALISFPLMTLLAFLAKPTVLFLFGEEWIKMSTVLSILCIIGMLQSVSTLVGLIYKVFDKNTLLFKLKLIISSVTIIAIIGSVYLYKSIEITALTYGMTSLIALFPSFHYAGKIINASIIELISPIIRPFIISMFIGFIGWILFNVIPIDIDFIKLFLSSIFALLTYIFISIKLNHQVIDDLSTVIKEYNSSRNE